MTCASSGKFRCVDDLQFGAELGSIAASHRRRPRLQFPDAPGFQRPDGPVRSHLSLFACGHLQTVWAPSATRRACSFAPFNVRFSALTCWPIYFVGNKVFGKAVGTASAWIWVFFPGAIYFSVEWVWDTSIVALWLALVIAATLKLRGSDRIDWWVGYGALLGRRRDDQPLDSCPFFRSLRFGRSGHCATAWRTRPSWRRLPGSSFWFA